jgi:hypothetical protein
LRLRTGAVGVEQHVLDDPPRLAIDLRRTSANEASGDPRRARVVDVRFGLHDGFTRLVVETDARASHLVERTGPREVSIRTSADAAARHLSPPGDLVAGARLEPDDEGASLRLSLAEPGVELREAVLESPPRLVVDLVARERAGEPRSAASRDAARTSPPPGLPEDPRSRPGATPRGAVAKPPDASPVIRDALARAGSGARPTIYKWTDVNGVSHYTTDPNRIPKELRRQIPSPSDE